jgi:error-prone DNA polymerase
VVERLVVAGAFDALYGIGLSSPVRRRGRVTRRDLLLQVADLDRHSRATARAARASAPRGRALARSTGPTASAAAGDVVAAAKRQAMSPAAATAAADLDTQLTLDLGDAPGEIAASGLPEMTDAERVRAELEVLGLDASRHVVDFYTPMLEALGVTRSRDLLHRRNQSEVLVAGVKVATQTPPVRSGRRVVFLTLDDATGPVDATFFEDVQGPYAATVFGSWLLLVRGVIRRTGPRGISIRATGAWELGVVHDAWRRGGRPAVLALLGAGSGTNADGDDAAVTGRAESRSSRPVMSAPPAAAAPGGYAAAHLGGAEGPGSGAGGMGQRGSELGHEERVRRVLVHASGFRQSPYADIKPQGADAADTRAQAEQETRKQHEQEAQQEKKDPPSKLWHSSPGSSGW